MYRLATPLIFALVSAVFAAPPQSKPNQANPDDMWVTSPVPALPTNVKHHTFRSASMLREVGFCLYLTPGYERGTQPQRAHENRR